MLRFLITGLLLITTATAQGEALDEVNLQRSRIGLPPLVRDEALSKFAQMKAEWQAARRICVWRGHNGHEGPSYGRGTREGTGVTRPSNTQGWLSCLGDTLGQWSAGAGAAYDREGNRYNCLVIRCPNGIREHPRTQVYLIPTYHLTPGAPRVGSPGSGGNPRRAAPGVCPRCGRVH